MLTGEDILFLYGASWDGATRLSKHHLAERLARHNKVLYIETPCSIASVVRHAKERGKALRWLAGPRRRGDSLWVHTFLYPVPFHGACSWTASPRVNRLNQYVVLPRLRRDLAALQMERPIVFALSANGVDLLSRLPRRLLVYHCSDKFAEFQGVPSCYGALERQLIREADVLITTSRALLEERRDLNPNSFCVPNGADIEHFGRVQSSALTVPAKIARLTPPIVGYVGTIATWFDQEMVAYAAEQRPEWQFVLIGPAYVDLARLCKLPNVHLLGPRPYSEVPRYVKGFDAAICPFKVNELTRNVSPIKFYEYLASGKPIVATWMQELEQFQHLCAVVKSPEAFVAGVRVALRGAYRGSVKQRLAEARRHSWENVVGRIEAIVVEALRKQLDGPLSKARRG
jgi:glycosyltransferase involved in cell wall biosynthesis